MIVQENMTILVYLQDWHSTNIKLIVFLWMCDSC